TGRSPRRLGGPGTQRRRDARRHRDRARLGGLSMPNPDEKTTDEIRLTGLTVFGRHGVFAHEREDGQDFTIDLRLRVDLADAAASDDVTDTVHYGELAVVDGVGHVI